MTLDGKTRSLRATAGGSPRQPLAALVHEVAGPGWTRSSSVSAPRWPTTPSSPPGRPAPATPPRVVLDSRGLAPRRIAIWPGPPAGFPSWSPSPELAPADRRDALGRVRLRGRRLPRRGPRADRAAARRARRMHDQPPGRGRRPGARLIPRRWPGGCGRCLTSPRSLKEAITATLRYEAAGCLRMADALRLGQVSYSEVDGDMRLRGIVLQPWRSIRGEVAWAAE